MLRIKIFLAPTLLLLLLLCNVQFFNAYVSSHSFTADIFDIIATKHSTKNVVFSPIAIQVGLASIYIGAQSHSAEELRTGLSLGNNTQEITENCKVIFSNIKNNATNATILNLANRIFHQRSIAAQLRNFDSRSLELFGATTQEIDFRDKKRAVREINNYIATNTENHITNIIKTKDITSSNDTSAMLVNGIYFKAEWKLPFDPQRTRQRVFFIARYKVKFVETFIQVGTFRSGAVPSFRARAIELDFKHSGLSMLILIPKDKGGLKYLIQKLMKYDLEDIVSELTYGETLLRLPKFKIKFNIDLKNPLQKLGINSIFDPKKAELEKLFKEKTYFSAIKHSTFIEINEYGALAKPRPVQKSNENIYELRLFYVDRPFVYIVRSNSTVYFAGHVVDPEIAAK